MKGGDADQNTLHQFLSNSIIDLSDCNLRNQGIVALADQIIALKVSTVERLILRGNGIRVDGCKAIGRLLKENIPSLTVVDLYDNIDIRDKAQDALAEALEHNHIITHIELDHVQLGTDGNLRITHFLKRNRKEAGFSSEDEVSEEEDEDSVSSLPQDSSEGSPSSKTHLSDDYASDDESDEEVNAVDVFSSLLSLRRRRAERVPLPSSVIEDFDSSIFKNWSESEPFIAFSKSEAMADSLANQVKEICLSPFPLSEEKKKEAFKLARERDEAFKVCLVKANDFIAYHASDEIQREIHSFKAHCKKWVSSDAFSNEETDPIQVEKVLRKYNELNERYNNYSRSVRDELTLLSRLTEDTMVEVSRITASESSFTSSLVNLVSSSSAFPLDSSLSISQLSNLLNEKSLTLKKLVCEVKKESEFIKSIHLPPELGREIEQCEAMIFRLFHSHERTQLDVFESAKSRAVYRLSEFEWRSSGAPSTDAAIAARRAEKKARIDFKVLQLTLEEFDSDSDTGSLEGSEENQCRDIGLVRTKWKEAALTLEREAAQLMQASSTFFPEIILILDPKAKKDLLDDGPDLATARSFDHYEEIEVLSQTASRQVYKMKFTRPDQESQVLVLKSYSLHDDTSQRAFRKEIAFLRRLSHPNVVSFSAAFIEKRDKLNGYVEMPFYDYGDLWNWKVKIEPDLKLLRYVFRSALIGINHIHSCNVIHSDLKPQNILIDENHCVKIADFDVSKDDSERAKELMTTAVLQTAIGYTTSFVAPELLQPNAKPTVLSDMYSFGLTLFDVYLCDSAAEPPPRPSSFEIANQSQSISFPAEKLDSHLITVLSALLSVDAEQRPTSAKTLRDFAFFHPIQETDVLECSSCFFPTISSNGITCSIGNHFTCTECLSRYLGSLSEPASGLDLLDKKGRGIRCPIKDSEKHNSEPLSDQKLAQLLSNEDFQKIINVRDRFKEQRLHAECETRVQAMKQQYQSETLFDHKRGYIIEKILTLGCPRCNQAFVDFDGCFALECNRCKTGFCAWCLTDCGDFQKAHAHVYKCPKRLIEENDFHGTRDEFDEAQRIRRQRLLNQYLNEITDDSLKNELIESLETEINDLKLKID